MYFPLADGGIEIAVQTLHRAAGLLVGVLAAVAVTRLVSGLLVNVSATDPLIFGGAALFLAVVALVASGVPAIRAARTDPNSALRCG